MPSVLLYISTTWRKGKKRVLLALDEFLSYCEWHAVDRVDRLHARVVQ